MTSEDIDNLKVGDYIYDKRNCTKHKIVMIDTEASEYEITNHQSVYFIELCNGGNSYLHDELLDMLVDVADKDGNPPLYTKEDAIFECDEWLKDRDDFTGVNDTIARIIAKIDTDPNELYKDAAYQSVHISPEESCFL